MRYIIENEKQGGDQQRIFSDTYAAILNLVNEPLIWNHYSIYKVLATRGA